MLKSLYEKVKYYTEPLYSLFYNRGVQTELTKKNIDLIKFHLDYLKYDVNKDLGSDILESAIREDRLEVAKVLISARANIGKKEIRCAIGSGNIEILKLLLENKGNLDVSPLNTMIYLPSVSTMEEIKLLIDNGLDFSLYHGTSQQKRDFILTVQIAQKIVKVESLSNTEDLFLAHSTCNQNLINGLVHEYQSDIHSKIKSFSFSFNPLERTFLKSPTFDNGDILSYYYKTHVLDLIFYSIIGKRWLTPNIKAEIFKYLTVGEILKLTPSLTASGFNEFIKLEHPGEHSHLALPTSKIIELYIDKKGCKNTGYLPADFIKEEKTFLDQLKEINLIDLHKAASFVKSGHLAIDLAKFIYAPNSFHAAKLASDAIDIYYHTHGAVSIINIIPLENFLQWQPLFPSLSKFIYSTASIFLLSGIYTTACSAAILVTSGYNFAINSYDLYHKLGTKSFKASSYDAYKNLAKMLSETPLQSLYNFSNKADEYAKEIEELKTETKQEIFQELLNRDTKCVTEFFRQYSMYIDIKYRHLDKLDQVNLQFIVDFQMDFEYRSFLPKECKVEWLGNQDYYLQLFIDA